jgi:acetyl esterase/lipase
MPADIPKPPFDPEVAPLLDAIPPGGIPPEGIPALRKIQEDLGTVQNALGDEPFTHEEHTTNGPNGPVTLSVFHPEGAAQGSLPALFYMHSGGMICGNRFTGLRNFLLHGKAAGAIVISVEYRLAPEFPFPAGMEDCYAGLSWVGANLSALGIDPARLMVAGQSAGGNLAVAMAILARDRQGPRLCAQLLDCGMYDDRMANLSSRQYANEGTWPQTSNETSLSANLGQYGAKATGVNPLAAVIRVKDQDLRGLPPAFITVGGAETFRDENLEMAQKFWAAGVQAELHVWPGGYHCFDMMMPDADISKKSLATKTEWVKKVFGSKTAAKL